MNEVLSAVCYVTNVSHRAHNVKYLQALTVAVMYVVSHALAVLSWPKLINESASLVLFVNCDVSLP